MQINVNRMALMSVDSMKDELFFIIHLIPSYLNDTNFQLLKSTNLDLQMLNKLMLNIKSCSYTYN